MGGGNGGLGGGSLGGGGLSKHQRYRYGLTVDSQFSGEAASQLSDEAHDTHSEHLNNGSPRGHRQQLDMPHLSPLWKWHLKEPLHYTVLYFRQSHKVQERK